MEQSDKKGQMIIREANISDCESICRLNKDALGYDYGLEKTRDRLDLVLKQEHSKILVAEHEGLVVGYAHATDYECTYVDSMKDLLALAVDEQVRGSGIGRALLNTVEDWARKTGASGVRLVSGYNREGAHMFYQACGYINRKDQKNFIKMF